MFTYFFFSFSAPAPIQAQAQLPDRSRFVNPELLRLAWQFWENEVIVGMPAFRAHVTGKQSDKALLALIDVPLENHEMIACSCVIRCVSITDRKATPYYLSVPSACSTAFGIS